MKTERIFWLCFTTVALVCQHFVMRDMQKNQPSMVSAATVDGDIAESSQSPPDPMLEYPIFTDEKDLALQYLFTEPEIEQKIETSKDISANDSATSMDEYSRGYTDGYHRATEQMNCPYPSR